ncbi:LytR C-terminal domain-containing protein [Leekyejoonella antrihumi]|uniref:LytR family transcriptional regulator n=1 Tax=Leekyejoonella antrihumi TaxID=1660198 RepID=A0A563DUN5_9MICO|nr:LytR C-terminal domain-containing protein [Leekyejoonella antrihumi]TWP33968.1 LytR family transcriptional regulator [Leekyejoonella antrihumi]
MAAHARRQALTVVVALTLGVTLAGCGGDAPAKRSSAVCPTLLPRPTMSIPLSSIHLNVYNAAGRNNFASQISTELKWRGLKIISLGNDPISDQRSTPKTAEIRYGNGGKQIALTLATQVKDATLYNDHRTNPSVDLVLGTHFQLVPVPPPPASKVTINVYNTTYHSGLATQVAGEMRKRGFTVDSYGNEPQGRFWPDDVAVIMYGAQGEPAARRAALSFKGARLLPIQRTGTVVDVELGNKYTSLVPVAQATPKPTPKPTAPACK